MTGSECERQFWEERKHLQGFILHTLYFAIAFDEIIQFNVDSIRCKSKANLTENKHTNIEKLNNNQHTDKNSNLYNGNIL